MAWQSLSILGKKRKLGGDRHTSVRAGSQ